MSESGTILVVDDLPANRDLLARRLERCGFRVAYPKAVLVREGWAGADASWVI